MMVRSTSDVDRRDLGVARDDTAPAGTRPTASGAGARERKPRAPEPPEPDYGDPIDQASDDSFPASDPPPWTLGLRRAPVAAEPLDKP